MSLLPVPLNMVGSSVFGRFPKMSTEQTYNMIISDNYMVTFAGYKRFNVINPEGEGRGIYESSKFDLLFVVIDNDVWMYDSSFSRLNIGTLITFVGDVYITENNVNEIIFSDNDSLYVYHIINTTFTTLNSSTIPAIHFVPGFITFQNGRVIAPDIRTNFWYLSSDTTATIWPLDAQHQGEIATKATHAVATVRFPGRGNMLLVFGQTVTEQWYDVGAALFPYQRSQSTNLDYGCINAATIAENQNMVCWVAVNEQSGPAIMYTMGDEVKKISTDGIDFVLAALQNPQTCYGFMMRLSGHVVYGVSWPLDNISYLYDFNTERFFTLCDENRNVFIVKRVAFFNNQYYFVSIRDGNLYQLSADLFSYDYGDGVIFEIPMIRVTQTYELASQAPFTIVDVGFINESGAYAHPSNATDFIPRIDMNLSKDGGVNFGNVYTKIAYPIGTRANRLLWRKLGRANNVTFQFRFHGIGRAVYRDGMLNLRKTGAAPPQLKRGA